MPHQNNAPLLQVRTAAWEYPTPSLAVEAIGALEGYFGVPCRTPVAFVAVSWQSSYFVLAHMVDEDLYQRAKRWPSGIGLWTLLPEDIVEPFEMKYILDSVSDLVGTSSLVRAQATTSRNAPCPCGSGRKFKRCHGGGPGA